MLGGSIAVVFLSICKGTKASASSIKRYCPTYQNYKIYHAIIWNVKCNDSNEVSIG